MIYTTKLTKLVEEFKLEAMLPEIDIETKLINRKEVNRPALQLAGYYNQFDNDRIQIIGRVEHGYLESIGGEARRKALLCLFEHRLPCVIISKNQEVYPEMLEFGRKYAVPVYRTKVSTTEFVAGLIWWLRNELAERTMIHGVFVDIYGEGVLITGDSGIGKSETALELIKRGHRLVADDAVEIKKIADKTLLASCPELIRYLIEVRGIGIINVKELFGIGAVKDSEKIDLVIKLESWDGKDYAYDRLGINDNFTTILNTKVLCRTVPVRPGRNIAVICESAAISHRQNKMGVNTAVNFETKVNVKKSNK